MTNWKKGGALIGGVINPTLTLCIRMMEDRVGGSCARIMCEGHIGYH